MNKQVICFIHLLSWVFLISFAFSAPTRASVINVDTELALLIDGSGSISHENFELQKQGYLDALQNLWSSTSVFQDSSIAIGVWQFSSRAGDDFIVEHAQTVIDSLEAFNALISDIANMSKIGLSTNIGDTIADAATALLNDSIIAGTRKLIDVSTDGQHNIGTEPVTTASQAILDGIDQVNCIGIGEAANCGFIAGDGSFALTADSFADFQPLLLTKLRRELGVELPLPGTNVLFVAGILLLISLQSGRRRTFM